MKKPLAFLFSILFSLLFAAYSSADFDWNTADEIAESVLHANDYVTSPRPMNINVLRIDTDNPKIRFYSTPRSPNWGEPMVKDGIEYIAETRTQYTADFVEEARDNNLNVIAATNATGGWRPWASAYYNQTYDADVTGLWFSLGTMVSPPNILPVFIEDTHSNVRMEMGSTGMELGGIRTATAGITGIFVLENGIPIASTGSLEPRTGLGLCPDNRYVYLITIDGRQPASEGATIGEVGEWLEHFGADTGINLDGGGSTTMALWTGASAQVVNVPSQSEGYGGMFIGVRRRVAGNLGVCLVESALELTIDGPGGVSVSNPAGAVEGSGSYFEAHYAAQGESVTLTAYAPNPDAHEFFGWIHNDYFIDAAENPYSFSSSLVDEISAVFVGCEVYIPDVPSGDTLCMAGVDYEYTASGSGCSLSHDPFEYRFDWGDGSVSNWGDASQSHTWTDRGIYTVRAQARCVPSGVLSEWSAGLDVSVVNCIISTPDMPNGETSGLVNHNYEYLSGGAGCSNGHDVEYQFHWGIGFSSEWGPSLREKSWAAAGLYSVRVKARCAVNTRDTSSWSLPLEVAIEDVIAPCIITVPDAPAGAVSGQTGTAYEYVTGGSSCSEGHDVEYRFFWGDSYSDWGSASRSKTWASAGDYGVRAQARCAVNTGNRSGWSSAIDVTIEPGDETPPPAAPPAPAPVPTPVPVPAPEPEPDPEIVSPGPPPAPSGVNAGFSEGGEVVIRWNPVPGVVWYRLYIGIGPAAGLSEARFSEADGLSFHLQAEIRPNETDYSPTGLSPGVRYYFLLTSVDSGGRESAVSSEVVWAVPGTGESGSNDPIQWSSDMDSGAVGSDSSCFIATAAYGSSDALEVELLRGFRDGVLAKNRGGRAFIGAYYVFGPRAALFVGENRLLGLILRMHIEPFARVWLRAVNFN